MSYSVVNANSAVNQDKGVFYKMAAVFLEEAPVTWVAKVTR